MTERLGHALHDGKAEAEAADGRAVRRRVRAETPRRSSRGRLRRCPGPCPTPRCARPARAGARSSRMPPALGVLHRVDHEVLQDAAEHQRIGDDGKTAAAPSHRQAFGARLRLDVEHDGGERSSSATGRKAGVRRPPRVWRCRGWTSAAPRSSSARARCARRCGAGARCRSARRARWPKGARRAAAARGRDRRR